MNTLRILFMGTPEFAVGILKQMNNAKLNIVGVVTATDKPAGRGKKLHSSAVKQYAICQNMEVLQPTNLKSEEFQADLKRLKPNLIVVVAFRMLPKVVWSFPDYGTFNLHASLLPQYRGAAPINWAIINGETKTGVTTFFIDKDIDTGKIIDSKEICISQEDNVESLHDKLMDLGGELVVESILKIKNNSYTATVQKENTNLKFAPKLTKDNTKVHWNTSTEDISNFIRGLTPFPTAWAQLKIEDKIQNIKIFKVSVDKKETSQLVGKSCYDKERKSIAVYVKDGVVYIEELQFPGKKRMSAQALVNGLGWKEDYIFI